METYYVIKRPGTFTYGDYLILNSDLEQICSNNIADKRPLGALTHLLMNFKEGLIRRGKKLSDVNYSFEIPENFNKTYGIKAKKLNRRERNDFKKECMGISTSSYNGSQSIFICVS